MPQKARKEPLLLSCRLRYRTVNAPSWHCCLTVISLSSHRHLTPRQWTLFKTLGICMQQCSKVSNMKKRRLRRRIFFDALSSLRLPFTAALASRSLRVCFPFALRFLRVRFIHAIGMPPNSFEPNEKICSIHFQEIVHLKPSVVDLCMRAKRKDSESGISST